MRLFTVNFDTTLMAEDITDAFRIIGEHYIKLAQGVDADIIWESGQASIKPTMENEETKDGR
jgi:hypothetical protein